MGKKRAARTHTRELVDPLTLDRRGGPYQLWKTASASGFEVVVARIPDLAVITIGGVHESRGGFNAHWREGASSSVQHAGQGPGLSSVTKLKAWLREIESGEPEMGEIAKEVRDQDD